MLALWALDLELAHVVATTTEPMIGQIRLAWWREALERLDTAPPPAQPLLRALAADVLPRGIAGSELAALEDPWLDRLAGEAGNATALFALAARLLGSPTAGPLAGLARLAGRDARRAAAGLPPEAKGSLKRQWLLAKAVALGG